MKKIFKLGFISLSVAGLASCSTLGLGSSDKDQAKDATAQTASDSSTSTSTGDASTPAAKVSLKKNNKDQIVATIYTTYNNPKEKVKLQWKAPEGTGCYNTSFPIAKYKDKNDKTWASVELKQGNKYCKGTWTANVIYNKNVIATDSITA